MKLWTIQTIEAYKELLKSGVLRGKENLVMEEPFIPAYKWMITQMEQKIGNKPSEDCYPVWAWYQWKDANHKKPDLRSKGHASRSLKCILIEFEIPDKLVLLSDFEMWHLVFYESYISDNQEDDERFDNYNSNNKQEEIVASWNKIFDLDWHDEYVCRPKDEKMIQATLWELRLEWIKKVKEFVAK